MNICFLKPSRIGTLAIFLLFGFSGFAQVRDNFMASADGAFAMGISRERTRVVATVYLKNAELYESINLERSSDPMYSFSRCKFVDLGEVKTNAGFVEVIDSYPFPPGDDAYYRIRAITKEGGELVYPSVQLKIVAQFGQNVAVK